MKKTAITLAAASAIGIAIAPLALQASDKVPADALPPTYVAYQLVGEGHDLRGLEFEDGAYEARLRRPDGALVKVAVDARTGEARPATDSDRRRADRSPAPKIGAADAIQAVAMEGHWDVVKFKHRDGVWRVVARDDAGVAAKFTVDAETGAVRTREHR
ncbi:MAG: PepSY domain-containing protein [Rhodospirillales bacterium]|nr:PepSY domain-containing protein [Rhodospirillales bacterium]